MPSLGADMDAGTLTQWLVRPGDEVHRGDIVAVVDTDKSTIEIEIFENGVIEDLVVGEGEEVPVGTVLAHVAAAAAARASAPSTPVAIPATAAALEAVQAEVAIPAEVALPPELAIPVEVAAGSLSSVVHSPIIRHLAKNLGVDLAQLAGSGPGGEVTRVDVERAAARTSTALIAPVTAARVPSSPYARRLAAEAGFDLDAINGTGPHGSVIARDVVARKTPVAPAPTPAPAGHGTGTVHPDRHVALRNAIGSLMARSKREIPHYYLSTTIDVTAATSWLEQANMVRPIQTRLVLPALLIKATARAAVKVPEMNGFFADDRFTPSKAVHVGVAVSLRAGGVVAPAIHDVEGLSLDELMGKLRDLVGRARSGILRSSEMSDPTITVTNLGELGVESVFGVIYPPQVALVGFGQVTERAVARDGLIGARLCLTATLSADHRVSDGHRGARFLSEIDRILQEPERL